MIDANDLLELDNQHQQYDAPELANRDHVSRGLETSGYGVSELGDQRYDMPELENHDYNAPELESHYHGHRVQREKGYAPLPTQSS